jgi:cytidine deaminase
MDSINIDWDGSRLAPGTLQKLLDYARTGSERAFLTKPGGTRYGAAVLTRSGALFCAGQYSSFNHVTNVHAEMGAVVLATMSGDPDIIALGLVATSATTLAPSVCGVCRQFLAEHAKRTGLDICVYSASWDGKVVETEPLEQLLPRLWTPAPKKEKTLPWQAVAPLHRSLRFGDQVQFHGRHLGLVWHPRWPGGVFIKVKRSGDRKWKLPFSQYPQYLDDLSEHDISSKHPWGDRACIVPREDLDGMLPTLPVQHGGVDKLRALLDLLGDAGIAPSAVTITGSRAAGLVTVESNYDVLVCAGPENVARARALVSRAILAGDVLTTPDNSETWKLLCKQWSSGEAAVRAGRFAEAFRIQSSGALVCITWTRPEGAQGAAPEAGAETLGDLCGDLVEVREAAYTPSRFVLQADDGEAFEVNCWNHWGRQVLPGDRLRLRGAVEGRIMTQVDPDSFQWEVPGD